MTSTLTPSELGFPGKFQHYYRAQLDAVFKVLASDDRFVALSAMTGAGKSLQYMTLSRMLDARTLVLVGTKGLQSQLLDDFATVGLVDMRGQSNYPCVAVDEGGVLEAYGAPGSNCAQGPCRLGVSCPLRQGGCTYYDAQARARDAQLVVTNYAYWLALSRRGSAGGGDDDAPPPLGEFDLLVCDEAHTAADWLSSFCTVKLDRATLRLAGLSVPPRDAERDGEDLDTWVEWAKSSLVKVRQQYKDERNRLGNSPSATYDLLQLFDLANTLTELTRAANRETSTAWVIERTPGGAQFAPVWPQEFAEPHLFRAIPRVVLTSATITPTSLKYLGVDATACTWVEMPSTFPVANRPFIYLPTAKVDRNISEGEMRMLVNKIDRIVEARLDRKGVIHTVSYHLARDIYAKSKWRDVMLIHDSDNARDVIARFKRAQAPCVLVSPSVEEGYDFPYDECRYQIIAKVPFMDTRSPLMKARCSSDKGYSNHVTARKIVQRVGRSVRTPTDKAETFILDEHWGWFKHAAYSEWPKSFRQTWRQETSIPEPLAF